MARVVAIRGQRWRPHLVEKKIGGKIRSEMWLAKGWR